MTHVIIAHEKHGDRVLAAVDTKWKRHPVALPLHLCIKLIRERLEHGWYSDTDHTTATMILSEIHHEPSDGQEGTHRRAWEFLYSRCDAQYENLTVERVEE